MSVYACSDLHGQYSLWEKIRDRLKSDDVLYCLGDNLDRGNGGYKICQEQARAKNIITLKGNHEDLAAAAIPDLLNDNYSFAAQEWFMNGGNHTWETIAESSEEEIYYFRKWCQNLPTKISIVNKFNQIIHLTHAGFTLGCEDLSDPLWDRQHFYNSWPGEWPNSKNTFIVHGHTPVQYLSQWLHIPPTNPIEIIKYCDGHKFDIDLGSVISHRAALLNLDTFEVTYIE